MYIKISKIGNHLPEDAPEWDAVLDTETGLMWRCKPEKRKYDWHSLPKANKEANRELLCGYNDWRVPTIEELKSLVMRGMACPSIDTDYFPDTPKSYFRSSSSCSDTLHYAHIVDFAHGTRNSCHGKEVPELVRLVRGGK